MNIDIKISPENLLPWGDFQDWVDGASAAPTEHTLTGAGASVAREATIIKKGTYSAAVTRSGANALLYYDYPDYTDLRGRTVTLGCWIYASVASRGRLSVDDGVSSASNSSYHTGGSSWEYITVTHVMNPSATQLRVGFEVNTGDTTVYFDGAILCEGDTTFTVLTDIMDVSQFKPANSYRGSRFDIPRREGSRMPHSDIKSKSIQLVGMLNGATPTAARNNLDTLLKVINTRRIKANNEREKRDLYLYDDRLLKVHVMSDDLDSKAAMRVHDVKLRFSAPDPFFRATNKTRHKETISASPTTFTVTTVNGSAHVRPIITITNNGSNVSSITFENRTTGQVFAYTGSLVTGQDLVVDTELLTVKNNGTDDIANFTGDTDMHLFPETNTFYVLGLVNAVITLDWYDRWY